MPGQKLRARVSSPCSSPHTRGSRPCRRTACPAGGAGSSCSRNSWSGRVCSWLGRPAVYVTEPRHTSHKPLKGDRRDEEKGGKEIRCSAGQKQGSRKAKPTTSGLIISRPTVGRKFTEASKPCLRETVRVFLPNPKGRKQKKSGISLLP